MSLLESLVDFVTTPPRQSGALASVRHRPWPLPKGQWVLAQTWLDLLFAHWRLPASLVRANVPPELPLDEFDGAAWIGVTPFRLTGLRAHWTYPLPVLSAFPELNVRTYVSFGGKPGIYFFSLDAGSALAVAAARRFYRLPYYWSEMSAKSEGREVDYRSRRRGEKRRRFAARYGPDGPEFRAGAADEGGDFFGDRVGRLRVAEAGGLHARLAAGDVEEFGGGGEGVDGGDIDALGFEFNAHGFGEGELG